MSDLAKGIIDSLQHDTGEIDHVYHAKQAHKHAASIVNRTHSGEHHTAEALALFEHSYMLLKSLGLDSVVGEEPSEAHSAPTSQHEEVDKVELPEGHRFVTLRKDQLADHYTGSGRKIASFVESYQSVEEAYAAARTWQTLPAIVAEISASGDQLIGQMRYMFTAEAAKDPDGS